MDKTLADFKGKRISATKGTTSEQSIVLKGGKPVTFRGCRLGIPLPLEQNKAVGFVTNTMTGIKMISQAKKTVLNWR